MNFPGALDDLYDYDILNAGRHCIPRGLPQFGKTGAERPRLWNRSKEINGGRI